MAELIVKTYGSALFDLAREEGLMNTLEAEAKVILAALNENVEFLTILNHPKISKDEKVSLIENTFTEKISKELIGLMVVVIKKDRYNYLTKILKYFLELIKEENRVVTAYITSAKTLNQGQQEKVIERLGTLTKKKVEPVFSVEESLIGGLVIRIGDKIVDNSVKGKIENMAKELVKLQLA
jgi:F-type H+-transporting ATPase subunit delta